MGEGNKVDDHRQEAGCQDYVCASPHNFSWGGQTPTDRGRERCSRQTEEEKKKKEEEKKRTAGHTGKRR